VEGLSKHLKNRGRMIATNLRVAYSGNIASSGDRESPETCNNATV